MQSAKISAPVSTSAPGGINVSLSVFLNAIAQLFAMVVVSAVEPWAEANGSRQSAGSAGAHLRLLLSPGGPRIGTAPI